MITYNNRFNQYGQIFSKSESSAHYSLSNELAKFWGQIKTPQIEDPGGEKV